MDPFQMPRKGTLLQGNGPAAGLGNADDNHRIFKTIQLRYTNQDCSKKQENKKEKILRPFMR